ncbi:hypothetical protein FWG86_01570 [Candidatus Saccharibacteria bacterium]|nr:hypothetical protein [Candidatus Saccharibacteria bacterium]
MVRKYKDIQGKLGWVRRVAGAVGVAAAFGVLVGMVSDGIRRVEAEEIQINATLGMGSLSITDGACSFANGSQTDYNAASNVLDISVLTDSIASNCLGISVVSLSNNGYTLTIEGPSTGNLTLANHNITGATGSIAAPAVFDHDVAESAWGFAIPSGQIRDVANGFDASYSVLAPSNTTNTAKYAAVPTTATAVSATTTANPSAHKYDFFFAVSAGTYVPTGTYRGVVTITAAGNAAPMPTEAPAGADMQRITLNGTFGDYFCPTSRTRVVDARDNNSYWIRKVGDLCWMETNLAYKGGGTNTYGDTMTITAGTTGPNALVAGVTGSSGACYGDNATMNTNGQGCFWEPTGSNITTGTTDPSTSTTGTGQYGVLYNWCAAMGGQASACQTSTATQPDTTINVCPSGWRLPTGNSTTGEFTLLNNTINSGSTSSPTGLLTNGLYMYAGFFNSGSFLTQGSIGYYWSSTVGIASNALSLYYLSSNVYPAYTSNKGRGYSVRCVAP